MKDEEPTRELSPPTWDYFRAFVHKIISVPKGEIDKQKKEYRQIRKEKKQKALLP